jgi:hypothetical protein
MEKHRGNFAGVACKLKAGDEVEFTPPLDYYGSANYKAIVMFIANDCRSARIRVVLNKKNGRRTTSVIWKGINEIEPIAKKG